MIEYSTCRIQDIQYYTARILPSGPTKEWNKIWWWVAENIGPEVKGNMEATPTHKLVGNQRWYSSGSNF